MTKNSWEFGEKSDITKLPNGDFLIPCNMTVSICNKCKGIVECHPGVAEFLCIEKCKCKKMVSGVITGFADKE